MKNWGWELKVHRMRKKMTQLQLAERIDVTPETISYWETGRRKMSMEHAEKAFGILGCELVLKRRST